MASRFSFARRVSDSEEYFESPFPDHRFGLGFCRQESEEKAWHCEELLCGLATMQEFEDSVPSLLQLLESKYSIVCIFFVLDSHSIAPEANVSLCLVCVN